MSKRRKGYPSEKQVKSGEQIVHGEKELTEKLGRNGRRGIAKDISHVVNISRGEYDGVNRNYFF
jgi:hypothetical protein